MLLSLLLWCFYYSHTFPDAKGLEQIEQIYGGKNVIHIPGSGETFAVVLPPRHLGLYAALAVFLLFLASHHGNDVAHFGIFCAGEKRTLMKIPGRSFSFLLVFCVPGSGRVGMVKSASWRGSGLLTKVE